MRRFRFGLQCSRTPSMAAWRALARKSEDLGYSCLYVPDHFGDQFGPIVALTVAAEATTTLRVGSLVFDNDYRHPVVLAKEIATLDLASEGRVEFGLGAGWMTTDYEEAGIPLDPAGVRVERMLEGLEIMRRLWSGETATFSGAHYAVTGAKGLPRPHTTPHPPILIGGGSRRILSIAGREADIVGINPDLRSGRIGPAVAATLAPEKWDERLGWVRAAAGDRFDALELQVLTFGAMVVPNRDEVLAQLAPAFGVDPSVAAEIPITMVGTVDEICEQLVARRERWGFNYIVVHEGELDAFAPVVERLAGT
ncbi:MAG: TIGR03621 family F420-dependent LLM class oxidoreductase [Acidimicrobiales bacterium]